VSDPALAGLEPPADPRARWDVPAFGSLPQVASLDELVTRVVAPNPGPMSLDGTNTYVVTITGSGAAMIVDPGPDDADHRRRVEDVVAAADAEVSLILVTHHHYDHAEAAQAWAAAFGCRVAAPTADVAGERGRVIAGGDVLEAAGLRIDAVATPGHCSDHTAFRLPTGTVLTGDHILGRGTSVVAWPDGDLAAYLESLRRVLALGPDALYPGHGPEMADDPEAVVRFYLDHRAFRARQVLAVLAGGAHAPADMVRRIYTDVGEHLWPAAERSTLACLHLLAAEGRVVEAGENDWRPAS